MRVRAAGLLLRHDALLLVQHRKEGKSYWLLPGGGVKVGERLEDCLKREFREELNLDIEISDLILVVETISGLGEHILQPTFSVTATGVDTIEVGSDKRVVDYRFFKQDAIDDLIIYPDIRDELHDYLRSGRVSHRYVLKKWLD